jgi:hypothetical protein
MDADDFPSAAGIVCPPISERYRTSHRICAKTTFVTYASQLGAPAFSKIFYGFFLQFIQLSGCNISGDFTIPVIILKSLKPVPQLIPFFNCQLLYRSLNFFNRTH